MEQKLAIIVGVGPGLGKALAQKFAHEGCRVVMMARNEEGLKEIQQTIEKEGGKANYITADASDPESLKRAFRESEAEYGEPDIVIYNVSVFRQISTSQLKEEDLEYDFKVDVEGGLVTGKYFLPAMKEKGGGVFIFTGGGTATNPYYEVPTLSVGKAALRNLALCFNQEFKDTGVHVTSITINGMINPGTKFAPERIADTFWEVANRKPGNFEPEINFNG